MFGGDWMDGPRAAFATSGDYGPGGYEGWQPWARREHHEHHEEHGPGRHGGPGGPGGPWGPWGLHPGAWMWRFARRFPFGPGFGPGGHGPRMFGRGDLKYALLDLLRERPKHGYEMIKDLEDRSGGFYTPSAGAIYPTLQLLEDRGWVTAQTAEGKKVYAITDEGRAALTEHQERAGAFEGPGFGGPGFEGPEFAGPEFGRHRHGGPFGRQMRPELRELRHESMEVARLMRAAVLASGGDPERLKRLRQIVARTRGELDAFLGQSGTPGAGQGPATSHEGPVEQV